MQSTDDPWAIAIAPPNPDKWDHERQKDNDDPINYLHPFRLCVAGKPNSGKTNYALSCISRQTPPFERIVVWHSDGEAGEYTNRGIDAEVVRECPPIDIWTAGRKELLVIDDVALSEKNRGEQTEIIDRTFGYASTHRGLSIICTAQNMVQQIPINVRRMCNIFAYWSPTDKDQLPKYARAAQQSLETMEALIDLVDEQGSQHAFIVIDLTGRGAPYKLNGTRDVRLVGI